MSKTPKRVIQYVNRLRAKLGMAPVTELEKGIVGEPSHCTIARTIAPPGDLYVEVDGFNIFVGKDHWEEDEALLATTPPKYVREFIARYDAEKYPHLIEAPLFEEANA